MKSRPDVKRLQKAIDKHRKNGVTIEVSHGTPYGDTNEPETIVSIAFSEEYDAMDIGEELCEIIGDCDSGAGLGFRDLQLCECWPGLK